MNNRLLYNRAIVEKVKEMIERCYPIKEIKLNESRDCVMAYKIND